VQRPFIAFHALLALAWTSCRPVHPALQDPPPEVTLGTVRMQYFRGSQVSAVGSAERLTYHRHSADFVATNARMRFPGHADASRPTPAQGLELRAPEVRGNLAAKQATGLGGVWLKSSSGLTGQTERAHFDGVTMEARGTEPVRIEGPGYRLDASAFALDLHAETLDFENASTLLKRAP